MRLLIFLSLLVAFVQLGAQERFVDSLFQVQDLQTYDYAINDGDTLRLDLYLPIGDPMKAKPIIVWMHGGGFAIGSRSWEFEQRFFRMAASKGYAVASISYRLLAKEKGFSCDVSRAEKMHIFKEASIDLWDALYYLSVHHEKLGIDPKAMIVGGSSAGAEGVLNAIYMKDWLFEEPTQYDPIQPIAIFSLAGAVIDSRYITKDNAIPALLFHGTTDELVPYATAPHHYCKANQPGYIWLDGSRTIANRLKALNTSYLFYSFLEKGHGVASMPYDYIDEVFQFLHHLLTKETVLQKEVTLPPELNKE